MACHLLRLGLGLKFSHKRGTEILSQTRCASQTAAADTISLSARLLIGILGHWVRSHLLCLSRRDGLGMVLLSLRQIIEPWMLETSRG